MELRLRILLEHYMGKVVGYSYPDLPPAYNAWLIYRLIVDMVLVNDVTAFTLYTLAAMKPVDDVADVAMIASGVLIVIGSIIAKVSFSSYPLSFIIALCQGI